MWILGDYFISQNNDGYFWKRHLADELFMLGRCTVNGSVLILHAYENMDEEAFPGNLEKWNSTEYYMTVSETGVTEIFTCADNLPVDGEIKKQIGTQIGCTMRYRQG